MDLVRLLNDHPEWRAELRRLLLTDELLALPELVHDLIEVQRRVEERLSRVEEQLVALAEAQRRAEEQLAVLTEAQRRAEERLGRSEGGLITLAEALQRTNDTVGYLKGRALEAEYRKKASAYFGRLRRRVRVVEPDTLRDTLEAHLSLDDVTDALLVDLILNGRLRAQPESPEVYLVVEVSAVVDEHDVERAQRRAGLLRQAGYRAIPVVAGERTTLNADDAARRDRVVVLQDGRISLWDEALQAWTVDEE